MTRRARRHLGFAVAAVALALPAASAAAGGQTIDWPAAPPASGSVVGDAVRINSSSRPRRVHLVTIDRPGVSGRYAVEGRVRYTNVAGRAYLEMWSVLADGSRYFTRTLASAGPLQTITGTSGWRAFALPFDPAGSRPQSLELDLVLPGRGTVWVGPLRLSAGEGRSGWWSDRTAGMVGGTAGVALGLLGALVGWAIARGRSRRLVVGACVACMVSGSVLLGAALVALAGHQPYAVWFPLALSGGLLVVVFGSATRRARTAYAGQELRRMRAMDA